MKMVKILEKSKNSETLSDSVKKETEISLNSLKEGIELSPETQISQKASMLEMEYRAVLWKDFRNEWKVKPFVHVALDGAGLDSDSLIVKNGENGAKFGGVARNSTKLHYHFNVVNEKWEKYDLYPDTKKLSIEGGESYDLDEEQYKAMLEKIGGLLKVEETNLEKIKKEKADEEEAKKKEEEAKKKRERDRVNGVISQL